ncbi:MAG: IS66 family insertion sequence element accessory protein TnpB [Lachnospiraceae bacterium]|nr:IS66 family insertion sequence element accessory protein TnpB [Lachnospiraceae bacterium]
MHPGKIYVATGYIDLRKGIDGLAGMVQEQFRLNVFEDALFLFCGKRTDRIKGLYWDRNGFVLLYKRLERGSFRWPRSTQEALQITAQQYEWLCAGFEVEERNKPVNQQG